LASQTTYAAVVGQVLVYLRRENKIRQADIARAAGVGQSTWSRIEAGRSALNLEQLSRVAATFGLTPGDVLARADDGAAVLEAEGITVHRDRTTGGHRTLALVGAAALGLLIAGVLSRRK